MAHRNNTTIEKNVKGREITLTRTVNAPIAAVWKGWTKPAYLAQWWGPLGWKTSVMKMDVRPGGVWHYCMRAHEGGAEIWGLVTYQEVHELKSLQYTETASNPQGEALEGKRQSVHVQFAEQNAVTTVVIRTKFDTLEDMQAMEALDMLHGYDTALAKLEQLIQKR